MKTIAIVNEKGGTGKTTTAVNLSAALGQLDRQVLLVDLDGQAASSRWLGVEEDTSFADALWQGEALRPIADVAPGVALAPGSGKLDSVAHDLRPTQGGQLRKLLSQVSGYDYCIIDCPPSLGNRLIGNALLAASHAIVPVETSILALDGLKILLTTFEDVRDGFGHEILLAGVLACRYDARTNLSRFILDELRRALPGKVFETVIRENVRVRECPASGQSIFGYAPDSRAAEDYMALAKELTAMSDAICRDQAGVESVSPEQLAPEEQVVAVDMRQQVDSLLHEFGAGHAGRFSAPAAPGAPGVECPTPVAEPAAEPVVEPAVEPAAEPAVEPAIEPVVEPLAEPAVEPPVEPPATAAAEEPHSNVEAVLETLAATPAPRVVESAAPADAERTGTSVESLGLYDQPAADQAAPADATPESPPLDVPQCEIEDAPADQPDEPQVDTQPPPAPAEEAASEQEDYPALRALLRDMAGQPGSSGSQDGSAGPEAADEEAASGSRKIFGKRSA